MCTCSYTHLSHISWFHSLTGLQDRRCWATQHQRCSNLVVFKLDNVWWEQLHSSGLFPVSEDSKELSGGVCSFLWETEVVGGVQWNHWRLAIPLDDGYCAETNLPLRRISLDASLEIQGIHWDVNKVETDVCGCAHIQYKYSLSFIVFALGSCILQSLHWWLQLGAGWWRKIVM